MAGNQNHLNVIRLQNLQFAFFYVIIYECRIKQNYEPVFSCQYPRRMGYRGDGGKWVCDPHRIKYGDCLGLVNIK